MEGMIIDKGEREEMKALEATEIQIYKNIELVHLQERNRRGGIEPFYYFPKVIDITEAHCLTNDERHIFNQNRGLTTQQEQIFCISSITDNTSISTLGREIAIAGRFLKEQPNIDCKKTPFYFVFGYRCHRAVCLGEWVFCCTAMFRLPGPSTFYLSLDGTTPISQVLKFNYLSTPTSHELFSKVAGFPQQLKLAYLLYYTTKKVHAPHIDLQFFPPISSSDENLRTLISSLSKRLNTIPFIHSLVAHGYRWFRGESLYVRFLLELKLREWISERLEDGEVILNIQGLGVIHMLAIMGYRWLIRMYCDLGRGKLSLDFPDLMGWTALHWAAFFNRNLTAQLLLEMGANPTIITKRTMEFPNGLTVADVALKNGHHKLAAHLTKISEEYSHLGDAATLDVSSSQVQLDADKPISGKKRFYSEVGPQLDSENHSEVGGNYELGKKRLRHYSMRCQAVKIQAAFKGLMERKRFAGNKSKKLPQRIENMELVH